jgi:hypothetical protein
MIQIDTKLTEATEHVEKAQKIMTELGHTKYRICGMVSKQMSYDSEQEVAVLLKKLNSAMQQNERLAAALEEYKLASVDERFTVDEIADYISGWAMGPYDSVREIGQYVLKNALSQLECDQDGISAVIQHKRAHFGFEKQ